MIDRYTKAVLTVIAMALTGLCLRGFAPPAHAQGVGCGGSGNPCYVTNYGGIALRVKVVD